MKTFLTALLLSVAFNSYAQAPDKTSDTQVIGRDEAVSVFISNDTVVGTAILQVSITQKQKIVHPTFGDRTLNESGRKPSVAVSENKPVTPEDVKVRLFASNGEERSVTALDPLDSFFGSTGGGSITWSVRFKINGGDLAALAMAEVEYAGARLIFKLRDHVPPELSTPRVQQDRSAERDAR